MMEHLPARCLTAKGPPIKVGDGPFSRPEIWYAYIDREDRLKRWHFCRRWNDQRPEPKVRHRVLWLAEEVWTSGRWDHEYEDCIWYAGTPWERPGKRPKEGPPTIWRELYRYLPDAYALVERGQAISHDQVREAMANRWGTYQVEADKFSAPSRTR